MVVQTGGTLQVAFDTLCNDLCFDGSDHGNHFQWIAATVLSIFQAYWIRCTAYCQMARYYRRKNNFHEYNTKLNSLRIAYEGVQKHLPDLLRQVAERIEKAKNERVASVKIDYDTFDPDWVMRTFGSADKETVRTKSFIQDTTSGRRLEVAYLWPGHDYTDGMKINSDVNDAKLQEFAEYNLPDYIKHLKLCMDRDAAPLRENLQKLQALFNTMVEKCKPTAPKLGPLHMVSIP